MSIWPVLIIGIVVGLFKAWRGDGRRLSESSSWQTRSAMNNKEELAHSLDALIGFLLKHEHFIWVDLLRKVRCDLNTANEPNALSRLSEFFGGMGSLNDLVFECAEANSEAGRLMDAVFRDMKLYYGGLEHRAQWAKLEEEYKDDLPPRIKHAFRKQ